jgi:hypothetical protein
MCTCDSAASSVSQAHSTLARPVLTRYVVRAPSRLSGGQKCKGRGGDGANRRQNRSAHAVREASLTLGRGALYARDQGATKTHLPLRGDAAQDTSAAAAASGSSTMLRSRVEGPHRGVRQLELAGRSRTTPPLAICTCENRVAGHQWPMTRPSGRRSAREVLQHVSGAQGHHPSQKLRGGPVRGSQRSEGDRLGSDCSSGGRRSGGRPPYAAEALSGGSIQPHALTAGQLHADESRSQPRGSSLGSDRWLLADDPR